MNDSGRIHLGSTFGEPGGLFNRPWGRTLYALVCSVICLLLWICLGQFSIASAQGNEQDQSQMEEGNRLYAEGRYTEAALTYEDLVARGIRSGALFYNLGNAYFKEGDLGRAILNYERATRLIPRDADLQANLRLASGQIVERHELQNVTFVGSAVAVAARWLTLDEMALVGLVSWFGLAFLWILWQRIPQPSARLREALLLGLVVTGTVFVGSFGLCASRLYLQQVSPQAIVLTPETNVFSGPDTRNSPEFTLHAGAKIHLLEARGQWYRLSLPGSERQGWIALEAVARIQL